MESPATTLTDPEPDKVDTWPPTTSISPDGESATSSTRPPWLYNSRSAPVFRSQITASKSTPLRRLVA